MPLNNFKQGIRNLADLCIKSTKLFTEEHLNVHMFQLPHLRLQRLSKLDYIDQLP